MVKVDPDGRIALPQDVRECAGILPGTEVDVREENGKVIIEPEANPERILNRMDALVEEISDREPTPYEDLDPQGRDHVETIRNQATQSGSETNRK